MDYLPIDENSDSEVSLDNSELQYRADITTSPTTFTTEDEVPIGVFEYMTGQIRRSQRWMQITGFFIFVPMFMFIVLIMYLAFSKISQVSSFFNRHRYE